MVDKYEQEKIILSRWLKKLWPIGCINHHTPIAQKVADEVVFRRFQGEGVEFF